MTARRAEPGGRRTQRARSDRSDRTEERDRPWWIGPRTKAAPTLLSAFIVTVQGLVAPQPPPVKPAKVEDRSRGGGEADRGAGRDGLAAIDVAGTAAIDPRTADGAAATAGGGHCQGSRRGGGVGGSNLALTLLSAFMVTVQGLVAPQPPPVKPAKVEPPVGVAVSVTRVPSS